LLDRLSKIVDWCHTTYHDGQHMFAGYGCANRDIAFAVNSHRLTEADFDASHPGRSDYRTECRAEVRAAADDKVTRSKQNAYATSLPFESKSIYSVGWYFPGDLVFDLAVAKQLDNPSVDYVPT